ncbi:VWA domain-containing protein [Clostridium sp. 19966]|uniref:VWA domain-containing protein n=1 Tax=Clostridium sp. 19966 TaxID=2768166 RepID=UPI0028DF6F03|nr:VWA domain-containing protein [Clostridium sp. 19966]MDT8717917.1 VWA domain-containing protein [Clostridium sp. 19966]
MKEDALALNRWRLILGKYAEENISFSHGEQSYEKMSDLLEYLYDREYSEERGIRQGGLGPSNLTVPEWITKVKELFPKKTVEILEKHALDKYDLKELLTDKRVLESLKPNTELLKSIMQMKHMMKGEVLETARKIVRQVSEELRKQLENDVKLTIMGRLDKTKSSPVKSAKNIDFKKTIRNNMKNYDVENNRLIVDKIYFNARVKRFNPWDIVIAIDESGSMLSSVIYSAVMAGIFSSLPMLKTKLIIFDTEVVDLTYTGCDVVETLMSVQLGGGTDISRALGYTYQLIENPHKTIVVLVTDLYEGGAYGEMYARAKSILEAGAKLIILTALDNEASGCYDKNAAERMASLGANVAAMTPGGLAKWVAQIIS